MGSHRSTVSRRHVLPSCFSTNVIVDASIMTSMVVLPRRTTVASSHMASEEEEDDDDDEESPEAIALKDTSICSRGCGGARLPGATMRGGSSTVEPDVGRERRVRAVCGYTSVCPLYVCIPDVGRERRARAVCGYTFSVTVTPLSCAVDKTALHLQ